jgi:hypothetical protein
MIVAINAKSPSIFSNNLDLSSTVLFDTSVQFDTAKLKSVK